MTEKEVDEWLNNMNVLSAIRKSLGNFINPWTKVPHRTDIRTEIIGGVNATFRSKESIRTKHFFVEYYDASKSVGVYMKMT